MNGVVATASCFFQPMEVTVIVLFGQKARRVIDVALNDVQWYFSELETRAARHGYWLISSECNCL